LETGVLFERVKSLKGVLAIGRKSIEAGESYQIRKPPVSYRAHFGVEKSDIGYENNYYLDVNI
jgi:hypothetical protein